MALGEFARLVGVLLGTLLFISFIAVDIRKAFKKGVHWVPGHALVLTALTIQIMNFVENQSNRALLSFQTLEDEADENEFIMIQSGNNFIMIHISRVMLCVLVAFFLPGMARNEDKWTKIVAVGLTVFIDIFSELFTVYRRLPHSKYGLSWVSFMVSDMLISISLLWLILLLICATRASKSIRNITTQRIPIILAEKAKPGLAEMDGNTKSTTNNWTAIQNQLLKSWIVVCVCDPQSIIAKSVLASSAALVVTMCIVSSIVGWIARGPSITIAANAQSCLKGIITILEVVFILLGWVVICWRTLASLPYCERWNEKSWVAWLKQFLVEDFWTGHIKKELKKEESKYNFRIEYFWTKHMEEKETQRKLKENGDFFDNIIPTTVWRTALLRCVLLLQLIVVFFSKVSRFLIEITFYNWFIRQIIKQFKDDEVPNQFEHYYKAILENVNVVGETPWSVFATNRKAIRHAEFFSEDGYKEGTEDCKSLVTFLKDKMSSPEGTGKMLPPLCVGVRGSFIPPFKEDETAAEPDSRLKFLCRTRFPLEIQVHEEETYFKYMSERSWSWKLTAVSLINIIVWLSPPCGKQALHAYFQAWQLMDIVDEWDPDSDSLLRKAADTEFNTLVDQMAADRKKKGLEEESESCPAAKITKLADRKKQELEEESEKEKQSTPVDWEKLAAAIALYKLYTAIAAEVPQNESENSGEFAELKNELESSLADIISACIVKVGTALVDNCRRWAQDLEEEKEEKLLKAIYIAGKCKGLLEALGWNSDINTTTEGSSMV